MVLVMDLREQLEQGGGGRRQQGQGQGRRQQQEEQGRELQEETGAALAGGSSLPEGLLHDLLQHSRGHKGRGGVQAQLSELFDQVHSCTSNAPTALLLHPVYFSCTRCTHLHPLYSSAPSVLHLHPLYFICTRCTHLHQLYFICTHCTHSTSSALTVRHRSCWPYLSSSLRWPPDPCPWRSRWGTPTHPPAAMLICAALRPACVTKYLDPFGSIFMMDLSLSAVPPPPHPHPTPPTHPPPHPPPHTHIHTVLPTT